ncbi:MAG TPA: hypothetical protein VK402_02165 [Blastococcus sp.]|nr:hypothetical protein [Blastococcus sp.]
MSEDRAAEEALRERLAGLASAASVPVPALEVIPDPKRRRVPAQPDEAGEGPPTIEVTEHLVAASGAEQDWHLAACLGWWASPVPRRRARQSLGLYTVAFLPHFVFGLGTLSGQWELPRAVAVVMGLLVGVVLPLAHGAIGRHDRRALEQAGSEVLRRAGRDAAAVARQAFGGRSELSRVGRLLDVEPTPAQRIAAAERHQLQPQQPLF